MVNWKWIGYNALLYLAAMQTIPRDIYEASALDGATGWKQSVADHRADDPPDDHFMVVVVHHRRPAAVHRADAVRTRPASASGGSNGEWQTIAQFIYKVGWKNLNLGYAAAMSWALFLIIVMVAGVNTLLVRRLGGGAR